jgi:hypothetical protein
MGSDRSDVCPYRRAIAPGSGTTGSAAGKWSPLPGCPCKPGQYKQSFEFRRNALIASLPVVPAFPY